jgi:hypothetical protein
LSFSSATIRRGLASSQASRDRAATSRELNQIVRWYRELQYFGFIVQTRGGTIGLNGKGTAAHWRLTELGYMRDQPTRDFDKWDGTPFKKTAESGYRKRTQKQNPVTENRITPLRKTVA